MPSPLLDTARLYVAAGLSVIPVRADGSKAASIKWGEYEERAPTDAELVRWFDTEAARGVAIVCGKVSGNLAVLDIESQLGWERWHARAVVGLADALAVCPIIRTPKGGRHIYCRIEEGWVAGAKLAMASKHETLIEIRGQGHYVLAPGCPAACHPLNYPYTVEQQGWLPHAAG